VVYIESMNIKSSAHYQREYRKRLREQGLVKKEVWIRPQNAKQLAVVEKQLRGLKMEDGLAGGYSMTIESEGWTTQSLFESLKDVELFKSGQAKIEVIGGVEQALHIVMGEYGDLPVFLTVSGEQIIVESVLWSVKNVIDVAAFNEAVLRTHKYFPLSSISLDYLGEGGDWYHMFGALSSTSILSSVVFEIQTLASNVIQATEAFSEFLIIPPENNC
jgi:uncharacterized protein YjfI (DUF2170 family)